MFAIRRAVARSLTSSALRSVAPQAATRARVTPFQLATPTRYFSQIRPRFAEEKEPVQEEPSAEELKEVREESVLERPLGANVYVGNLFFEVEADQLKQEFSKYGEVTEARVPKDDRGLSRGFGFVVFAHKQDAERAVEAVHDQLLFGRRSMVSLAKAPRHPRQPSRQASRNPPSKTLFIGNMSYEMSDRDLNDLFRDCKNVIDVRVAIDRRTGQPRGFAHADFETVAAAEAAAKQLTGKTIYGRQLKIDFTQPTQMAPRSSE